jgi:hypothetical protein
MVVSFQKTGGSRTALGCLRALALMSAVAVIPIAGTCVIERHMSDRDQLATDLAANRALWDRQGSHSYSYALTIGCDSCSSLQGHFRVIVAADAIDTVTHDTTVLDSTEASWIPTVGGLFRIIQNGLAINTSDINARFNSTLGYPESIWVDYDTHITGDEYIYRADSVTAR